MKKRGWKPREIKTVSAKESAREKLARDVQASGVEIKAVPIIPNRDRKFWFPSPTRNRRK